MTETTTRTAVPVRLDFDALAPGFSKALSHLDNAARRAEGHVPTEAFEAVAVELSPVEIAALVSMIVTVNAWNTVGVSTRPWEPGSYEA